MSDLLSKARQQAAATGADLNKPQTGGGGNYEPPALGATRLRLIGYAETGVHTKVSGGIAKTKPRVELTFELSGPKHEPKKLDDGTVIPHRIRIKEVLSYHEKANLIKLFNAMNTDGTARNFIDMLIDKAWRGTVSHYTFKTPQGERTIAQLRGKGQGYQIFATEFEDAESGELRKVSVAPAISEPRLFLWDEGDLEQWDSLDKFTRETIKEAENFEGSPIFNALIEAGREADTVKQAREEDAPAEAEPEEEAPTPAPAPAAPAKAPAKPAAAPKAAAKATPAKAAAKPAKAAPAAAEDDPLAGV